MGEECWFWKETQALHEEPHQNNSQSRHCDESATPEKDNHISRLFSAGGFDYVEPG